MLKALADRTGGQSFNLTTAACPNTQRAVELVCGASLPFRYLSSSCDGTSLALALDVAADDAAAAAAASSNGHASSARRVELFPAQPTPLNGARFELVGRLALPRAWQASPDCASDAAVVVTLRFGYASTSVERQYKLDIVGALRRADAAAAPSSASSLVARQWAQQLLARVASTHAGSDALPRMQLCIGRRFGIVTPNASLIVLDQLEQYIKHGIAPPASLPKLAAAYARRIASVEENSLFCFFSVVLIFIIVVVVFFFVSARRARQRQQRAKRAQVRCSLFYLLEFCFK